MPGLYAQCPITVDAGPDVYLCSPPTPTQLNGDISGDYLNFFWSPTTGMTGANTLSPTVNVSTTTNYVLTARAADYSNNLIVNGDFESGNSDFTSDYVYNPGDLVPEGVYDVLANPQDDHPSFAPCDDHTSGSGNMMVVNGAGVPNQNVWCQTMPVTPNTQYVFSAWVTSVVAASPALLQFSINGSPLGNIFAAPGGTCNWQQFFQLWNSGSNSSATICIVNQNTTLGGNDFALDDIVFAPTCLVTDTVTVHVVSITAAASPAITFIPCDGANVTLSGTGSSTGPNITYNWDSPTGNIVSGQNTLSPVVNAAGMYTLTVTYDNGLVSCTKTASVNVVESPNQLAAWINPPIPLGCGSSTTNLIGNSSQPAFSTYEWTAGPGGNIVSGANSKIAKVDQPAVYTLVVTNTATGCTATAEVTVTAATNPPTANASSNGIISCNQPTTVLSGGGSTTGPNITYAWTTPNGVIVSGQNMQNALAGAGGTYILSVTNTSNNCVAADTIDVAADTISPVVGIAPPGSLDCDTDTLTLSGTVNPSNTPVVWGTFGPGTIVSGGNTLTAQIISIGVYNITATNPANGCTATASVIVNTNYTPPVAAVSPADSITCQFSSVILSGNGSSTGPGFTYLWTPSPGGNIVSGGATLNPVVNAPATYTLLVTNTINACTATAAVPVVADTNIVVAVANAPDTLNCVTGVSTLNTNGSSAGPAMTYVWTSGDGNITGGANTPNPTVDQPGTYQLLLTNTANGCSATDLAVVAQNITIPEVEIAPPVQLTCANPTQVIQAQNLTLPGGFAYSWSAPPGGGIISGDSTLNPVINAPGLYVLTTTNLSSGCTAVDSVTIDLEVGTPVAVASSPGPLTCVVLTQTLSSAGSSTGPNFTYLWTTTGGNITGGADTPNPSLNQAGIYNLLITNTSNGCTATTSVVVSQNTLLPAAIINPPPVLTCALTQFYFSADGTGDATWTTIGGNIVSGGGQFGDCEVNAAGIYILSATDPSNGCTSADTVVVTANQQQPALSVPAPAGLSCLQTSLVLAATASGDSLSYQWQTTGGQFVSGQNTAAPVVDAPGAYSLTVTDGVNGCTNSTGIVVNQDITQPNIQITTPGIITCSFPAQSISAQNLSLPGTFSYSWTAAAGGNIVSGNNALSPLVNAGGDYDLVVTNTVNGCSSVFSVNVQQNTNPPVAEAGLNDTLTCNISTLTINGSGTGTGALIFGWTASGGGNIVSGQNTATPVVDSPGVYNLLVTNTINGCTATDAVQVFDDVNAPQANAGAPDTLTCILAQITLNGAASAGANILYNWTASGGGNIVSGPNNLQPVVDEPGIYTLSVTNTLNGCVATSQVTIAENITTPPAGVAAPGTLTCAVTSLGLAGTPVAGNYTWLWSTSGGNIVSGANTANPVIDQPGAYTLVVTDQQNGCSAAAFSVVSENITPPAISAAAPQLLTCAVLAVPVNGTVTQPIVGYTAIWTTSDGHFITGQNTLSASVDAPGTYLLTVQDAQNGCVTTVQTTVNQNIMPPVAQAAAPNQITCANPVVSLSGAGSSAGAGFTYAWSGGQITAGQNTLTPSAAATGPYNLTVTDQANGCTAVASTTLTSNTTPPTVVIASPGLLTCVQNTVTLDANASSQGPAFTPAWTSANGQIVSGQNSLNPVVSQQGLYTLTIQNSQNGCSASSQSTVFQNTTPPGAEAGPSPELHCNQAQATLQGSSPTPGIMAYSWTTTGGNFVSGANLQTPVVDAPGSYLLVVTNPSNGCTSTDIVGVTEVPPPAFEPELIQPDCHHPKGTIDISVVTGGTPPFTYSKNGGQTFSGQSLFGNLAPGAYDLVVRDAHGCTSEETAVVSPPFLPEVELEDFILIQLGDSVMLDPVLNQPASNIALWQWSPPDGLSCTDCPAPWAKPLRSTVYTLKITDLNGCEAKADIQLRVDRQRYLYAPNIFSPNGDGVNDLFTLYARGVKDIRSLQVFDRWGAEIFLVEHLQPNDELRGWNGTYRGNLLNPAVFVWQAVVEFDDGEVEVFSGDVTIDR
ncbi:MAG: gliding motility-associated C-terminal domain-containing protein [Lewinellaceae bacterium]|nr:gliding motility-associated C-terminal domain-containing protein [Lewinellaceae bacterium]